MSRHKSKIEGYYVPSFLRMQVDTEHSLLDLTKLSDVRTESIYLHEYCHFIQDVTTNYGLSRICVIVDYILFAVRETLKLPPGPFQVPVKPIVDAPDGVATNEALEDSYRGGGNAPLAKLMDHNWRTDEVCGFEVPVVEVTYYDILKEQEEKFDFGEACIAENMAFLIERLCYPDCPNSPDLPYRAADKLVELVSPEFGKNPLNVLALCDASLKDLIPGAFFYEMLLQIRDSAQAFATPEEVYSFCNNAPFDFHGASTRNALLPINSVDAIRQLHAYFSEKDHRFVPVRNWLEHLISTAVYYRQQHETFPLDIARSGPIAGNKPLAAFMSSVGTPLTTTSKDETSIADPRPDGDTPEHSFIWAVEEVYMVLAGGQQGCKLKGLCQVSGVEVDERCDVSPWSRTLDGSCAFGQMWRHWGLTDYTPIMLDS